MNPVWIITVVPRMAMVLMDRALLCFYRVSVVQTVRSLAAICSTNFDGVSTLKLPHLFFPWGLLLLDLQVAAHWICRQMDRQH